MKMTKRIFALVTAFVLCLAPMALMAGAADALDTTPISPNAVQVCGCGSTSFYLETTEEKIGYHPVGTANICRYEIWKTGELICLECGAPDETTELRNPSTHPTMAHDTERNCYYCPVCKWVWKYLD